MNKLFYIKLALTNLKKNSKTYFPYMLTCIGSIMMFYMMCAIGKNKGLDGVSGSESLKSILALGTVVIGIFSTIFLFYTNSFLTKRRKKEFGLYNILGMEKKHIAKMLFWETVFTSFSSMLIGLAGGLIGSKLMFLFLLKLLNFKLSMSFSISFMSIATTLVLFTCIFLSTLLFNLLQIRLAKPIELLHGGENGEKEPKTKWIITIIGIITLGIGYYMAFTIKSPLDALTLFFIAVTLVIIGTYCLFTSGSIALLKILRKNKVFYYKPRHFTSISGMIYRMKQNAVGLANICILSTMVLVILSSTVSLYIGMEDELYARYPRAIQITSPVTSENDTETFNSIVKEAKIKYSLNFTNLMDYRFSYLSAEKSGDDFISYNSSYGGMSNKNLFVIIPLEDYNRITGSNKTLAPGEVFSFILKSDLNMKNFTLLGEKYTLKEVLPPMEVDKTTSGYTLNCYYLVVDNLATMKKLCDKGANLANKPAEVLRIYAFDTSSGDGDTSLINEINTKFINEINTNFSESGNKETMVESRDMNRESFLTIYGSLFFLGIFLGILFLMATVLIIYYKQVSEGYDDKERFSIMQKVGMSKEEVRKSIKSQVIMVFFIPLVTAFVHIAFAFPMLTKLLALLNLTNINLFIICTIGTAFIFAAIYGFVYSLTAKVYYKIVN